MKQFLTLFMAAAIAGGAFTANADLTLQEAMQLKNEGKAIKMRHNTFLSKNKLMSIPKGETTSRFHKLMKEQSEATMRAPQRVTPKGDNIFGYLSYSEALESGLYEFNNTGFTEKWIDESGYIASSVGYSEGSLKGYCMSTFFGFIIGVSYVDYDFATGALIEAQNQDLSTNGNFLQTVTVDSDEEMIYGFGGVDGVQAYGCAPADDPFAYELVKEIEDYEFCIALTYNPVDKSVYGVNTNYDLVKIDKEGNQTPVMSLASYEPGAYFGGLVFDPNTELFYWTYIKDDMSSGIATIDTKTGAVDAYDTFESTAQFSGLFTTDEFKDPTTPRRPVAGEADFYKNSLSGIVTFTLPSEMKDGAAIEGKVEYRTYVDGQLYSTGNADAGSEVKANFAVEQGVHKFGMTAVVNGKESGMARVKTYVGNDTPVAPYNVVLTQNKVTWEPVTEGVHGGYIDAKAMEYTVLINGVQEGVTSETFLDINLDENADLTAYRAEVFATCNDMTSESSASNGIAVGEALGLPQYLVPTQDQFDLGTVYDANGDGVCWTLADGYITSGYSASEETPMDDWYFLPKMRFDDPEKFYSFAFEVALSWASYPEEYVEVVLCSEPDPRSAVMPDIIAEFSPESEEFKTVYGNFRVRQPGVYYIGIHCTSDGYQDGVLARNFSVEDNNILDASPIAADNVEVTAAEGGQLLAYVSFTMPTETMNGEAIDPATVLKATVSGGVADVTVTGKPGETVIAEVEATKNGLNTFTIVVSNGDLNSPVTDGSVRVGYDVPSTPQISSATVSEDMLSFTLTWDAVTTGYISDSEPNEGIIDPSEVFYDIYKRNEDKGTWEKYEGDIAETSYTYTVDPNSPQETVTLGVVAVNSVGDNGYLQYREGVTGQPYALPIVESFDGAFTTEPWIIYTIEGYPECGLYYTNSLGDAYADRETISLGIVGATGDCGRLGTPKFSTKGASEVTLTFDVCGDFELPKTTILADGYGMEEPVEIGAITCDKPGFNKVSVKLPEELLGKGWIGLYIQCEFENDNQAFFAESLSIDNGSSVATVSLGDVKIAGGKNRITVKGLDGQDVTVSTLDGRVAAKGVKVGKDASFNVEKGIYVVKAGEKKAKVIVK